MNLLNVMLIIKNKVMAKYKIIKDLNINSIKQRPLKRMTIAMDMRPSVNIPSGTIVEGTEKEVEYENHCQIPPCDTSKVKQLTFTYNKNEFTINSSNYEEVKDEKKAETTIKKPMSDGTILLLLALVGIGFYWILSRPSK